MRTSLTISTLLCILFLGSCTSTKEKKSAKYYLQHEDKIMDIVTNYEELYRHHPFNLGFSERDYSKIGLDVITDTVRYALTNQLRNDAIRETVLAFGYDTTRLRKLYRDMYDIKAIWLGRDEMYHGANRSMVTFLSFRSVAVGNPFLDRKYYTLVAFDPSILTEDARKKIESKGFHHIKDNIYFSIMGRFR